MLKRALLIGALLGGSALPAWADSTLPTFAQTDPASSWTGFYAGTEFSTTWGKGAKGRVGAAFTAGYDRELPNNLVLGIQASAGYAPAITRFGRAVGIDYATTRVKIGYDMGRLEPFVTTGIALARVDTGVPGTNPGQSFNNLFVNTAGTNLQATGTVGAGFNYAVTDHLRVGVAVTVGNGRGLLIP